LNGPYKVQVEAVTGFWWFALVLICASSALDGPICLLGLGPLVGWSGFEFARHVGDEITKLVIALQFLGAAIGFAIAEGIAFRQRKFRHLFVASVLTFPAAFMAFLNTLEVDNWILLVSIVFLLADGAVGLMSATKISD